ncbi:ghrelin O-acyltransferase [Colossoma macropomum]|uniref:ghrelin O-acyltransferase n=1 Tax=Colossoma macropomum TaxID=42526 RepID=UPI00186496A0|nr:ghrelin O-acyltransferase [Colossoma macropomum]
MDLLWIIFNQNPQLAYQLFTIPFAVIFYSLTTRGYLTLINRYMFLMLGGSFLAVLTMGPYSILLFITATKFMLLVHFVEPLHVHQWILGLQMCWQTFWHFYMQYQQYWLQEPADSRLLLAMSALMLLSQRVTSVSMDLQEGKVAKPFKRSYQSQAISLIPFLSYTLYFPALLGGPLCPFTTYVTFVEQISIRPPPSPLAILPWKILRVLVLLVLKYLLSSFLQLSIFRLSSPHDSPGILWIWILSLVLRLNYYAHWKMSECLNNAAGLGFSGCGPNGGALWDGLCDGDPWKIETSTRISAFARHWNGTTTAWLRRLVFQRCSTAPLFMTFGFSAWWHGLYPGQVIGFLGWAAAVLGDYKLHTYFQPRLTVLWKKRLYTLLSWAYTQTVIACVVLAIELQSSDAMVLLCTTHIVVVPFVSVVILFIF